MITLSKAVFYQHLPKYESGAFTGIVVKDLIGTHRIESLTPTSLEGAPIKIQHCKFVIIPKSSII